MSHRTTRLLPLAAAVWLAACGGLSDVGNQDNAKSPPTADAVVLNQPFEKDSAGNVTTRVRAGSEVFLSGKDSDGTVAPVLKFEWSQLTQGTEEPVKLVVRSANTVSFAAPSQDTQLQFRLKVTDANGQTDQKSVVVTVVGIADADHFLAYDLDSTSSRKLKLVAAASRDVTAAELQGLSDVEFEITVQRLVDYTTPEIEGPYLTLATQRLRGKWLAAYGAGINCDDPRNPVLQIAKPAVNIDEIRAAIDQTQAALEPNPAQVDDFEMKLQISISVVGGSLPTGVQPVVCAPDVPAATAPLHTKWGSASALQHAVKSDSNGQLELNLDQVLGDANGTQDTRISARAYFKALDPDDKRTNLLDWLRENGFLAGDATDFKWADVEAGSTAHAVYTNNFDLGFGRDMYARIGACSDGGPVPQIGQPLDAARAGQCDIAAVVINYASLEAATKKLDPQLAVAMEYTRTSNSPDRRIVQFYTFAPDLATGRFERVLSANLDGRGEKYMPQVCTVCHGGTPGALAAGKYPAAGDVGAAFLPWDLDSFLFADADGPGSDKSFTDQQLRSRHTRAAQADALRKLNQLAYLTFDDPLHPTRFALLKELVEGWYGRQAGPPTLAFVNTTFDGQYTPEGWGPNGADGAPGSGDENSGDAKRIYHDVFARNCRTCHVAQIVPEVAPGATLCERLTPATGATRPSVQHQLAIACYRQFIAEPALANRLSNGEMPFARLTMDRFWVNGSSGSAPGDELMQHLAQLQPPIVASVPGEPRADFTFRASVDSAHPDTDIGSRVMLSIDPAKTKFADTLQWAVERCPTPGACEPVAVSGSSSPGAFFVVPDVGTYNLSLTAATQSGTAAAPMVKTFSVAPQNPDVDVTQLPDSLQLGSGADVKPSVQLGNGGRESHRYWLSDLGNLRFAAGSRACDSAANSCSLDDTVRLEPTVTTAGGGAFTVNVTDANGPAIARSRTLSLTSGLAPTRTAVTTSPNNDVAINFAEGITVPQGERLELAILSGPAATGAINAAQLLPGATELARIYRPPARYANYDAGGALRAAQPEQIGFQLTRRRISDSQIVEQGTFTREVRIQATTTFADHVVGQVLRRQVATNPYPSGDTRVCTSCHGLGGSAEGVVRFDDDTTVYSNVRARVNLVNPANSTLLCWPAQVCITTHSGGDRDPNTAGGSDDDLATIRQWIEEGANNF